MALATSSCPEIVSGVYIIGGSQGTEDSPYLLTEDAYSNLCPLHGSPDSIYQAPVTNTPGTTTDTTDTTDTTGTTDTPPNAVIPDSANAPDNTDTGGSADTNTDNQTPDGGE